MTLLDRKVFLHCRSLFSGDLAKTRKARRVKRIIANHGKTFQSLFEEVDEKTAKSTIRRLLADGIFESKEKALARFPDLEELKSEVQASSTQEAIVSKIEETSHQPTSTEAPSLIVETQSTAKDRNPHPEVRFVARPFKGTKLGARANAGSLFSAHLPYAVQHLLLNRAQQVLEECLFEWTKQWMPQILEEQGADCPQAVELIYWYDILTEEALNSVPREATTFASASIKGGVAIRKWLSQCNRIRNPAVHRLPVPARDLINILQPAVTLARTLRDEARVSELQALIDAVQPHVESLNAWKEQLDDLLRQEMLKITEERARLEMRRKTFVEQMLNKDKRFKNRTGMAIRESLNEFKKQRVIEAQESDKDAVDDAMLVEEAIDIGTEEAGANVELQAEEATETIAGETSVESLVTSNDTNDANEAESQTEETTGTMADEAAVESLVTSDDTKDANEAKSQAEETTGTMTGQTTTESLVTSNDANEAGSQAEKTTEIMATETIDEILETFNDTNDPNGANREREESAP